MKPLFGIDRTANPENQVLNGEEFVLRQLPEKTRKDIAEAREEAEKEARKGTPISRFSFFLNLFGLLVWLGFFILMLSVAASGLRASYQSVPAAFWLVAGGVPVWLGLAVYHLFRKKKIACAAEKSPAQALYETRVKKGLDALSVPADAPLADIFLFAYKLCGGEVLAQPFGKGDIRFFNTGIKAFVEEGRLCLADSEHVWGFSLSDLVRIKTIREKIHLPKWNKPLPPSDARYSEYAMEDHRMAGVVIGEYHILEFQKEGALYGLYFPNYELPVFEALTGLRADLNSDLRVGL